MVPQDSAVLKLEQNCMNQRVLELKSFMMVIIIRKSNLAMLEWSCTVSTDQAQLLVSFKSTVNVLKF